MRDIVSPLDGFRSPFGVLISGGAAAFTPASLFASGEEGAWYEPSDTTAFASTTDLTPCGAGDTVGFLLDKSQGAGYSGGAFTGLGDELVTNGTFDTDSDWTDVSNGTGSAVISGGALNLINTSGTNNQGISRQAITLEVGKTYYFDADITVNSGGGGGVSIQDNATFLAGSQLAVKNTSTATEPSVFVATSATLYVFANTFSSVSDVSVDNISVRELPGNHATQSNPDSRPVLARVPETGRRNLLEGTEDLTTWSIAGINRVTVTNDQVTGPNGEQLGRIEENGAGSSTYAAGPVFTAVSGTTYTFSVEVKGDEIQYALVRVIYNLGSYASVVVDTSDGSIGATDSSGLAIIGTPTATDLGSGIYRVEMTFDTTLDAQSYRCDVGFSNSLNPTFNASGGVDFTPASGAGLFAGASQLEAASSATDYQKVVNEYDVTEAGVTSLWYLAFDGVDDGMKTAAIDFTATNAVTLFAGVTKESDANRAMIAETGAVPGVSPGGFGIEAPQITLGTYAFTSHGSIAATGYRFSASAPTTDVLSCIIDMDQATKADEFSIRKNGVEPSLTTLNGNAELGSGPFANTEIYIGSRFYLGGSSLFFTGKLFSLIVRGAASTTAEISDTESYVANLSGVTIP